MNNHSTAPSKARIRQPARTILAFPVKPIKDWIGKAACVTVDPVVFFAGTNDSDAEAKQVCARCPVCAECRDYALSAGEEGGVWGGLTEDERLAILDGQNQIGQGATAVGGVA